MSMPQDIIVLSNVITMISSVFLRTPIVMRLRRHIMLLCKILKRKLIMTCPGRVQEGVAVKMQDFLIGTGLISDMLTALNSLIHFTKIFSEIFENEAEILNGDIQVELLLEFSEAAAGCTKQLSFNADVPCEFCRGRGHPMNASTRFCHTCNGIGRVTIPPFTTTCSSCKGFGRIIEDYCVACKGSGVREGVMNVKVTIPAGVDTGDVIRVPKAGNSSGLGRSSGDLIIKLKVSDNAVFSREGADVYVDSYIHFTQAILGGNIEVPTLSGKMNVKIPKGVQHGQLVRLRSKGLPKSGFFVDRGDQYVRFCIKFPTSVTERQRVILEEFEKETMSNDSSSSEGSWWHHWINQLSSSNSFLQFSILMLIFIILGKALN